MSATNAATSASNATSRPRLPRSSRLPAERRHTLHFLRAARAASPVFLDTDVDMTRVLRHRDGMRTASDAAEGGATGATGATVPSIVAYVMAAVGGVLARRPDGNAAIGGRWNPKIVNYASVDAKLVLDRVRNGQRIVASVPLRDVDARSPADIQLDVIRFRDTPLDELPEFRGLLLMHRLPAWLGWPLFAAAVRDPRRRQKVLGTFAVSSLGHRAVNGFHAVGGTALTFNVGQIREVPVARRAGDGPAVVAVAPVMRLNMAFDHRVLDGAAAAEILTAVKEALETWAGIETPASAGEDAGDGDDSGNGDEAVPATAASSRGPAAGDARGPGLDGIGRS
jgi:pyruvate/2-oxoglutarate dehydrogenase complex dihydrolipoamide acyltransferase (E2) component